MTDLRVILESTDEGILVFDSEHVCTFVNKPASEMLGYQPEALLGQHVHETIHYRYPDGSPYPLTDCPLYRTVQSGVGIRVAGEVLWRKDGSSFPVEYASHPIRDGDKISGAVVTFIDITARKQFEEERDRLLAENRRRVAELDATITSIADGVVIYNPTGEIVRMNEAAERILGFSSSERKLDFATLMASVRAEMADGKPARPEEHPVFRALHGEAGSGVVLVVHRATQSIWVSVSAAPIRSPDGAILGAVSIVTDITPLHELQEQREDFLRMVSHDLRNPLAIVLGQAGLIQRYAVRTDLVRSSSDKVVSAAKRMNAMIQDLVDTMRLESGEVNIARQPVELLPFVEHLLDRAVGTTDVGRVQVDIAPRLTVDGDPDRLERILINLVSNALKYSPPGSPVTITAHADRENVTVAVADQGKGIAADELTHIFDRYYRARSAGQREGLGLGLFIARKLVEAHGGRIWVESKMGQGSTFYFALRSSSQERDVSS